MACGDNSECVLIEPSEVEQAYGQDLQGRLWDTLLCYGWQFPQ